MTKEKNHGSHGGNDFSVGRTTFLADEESPWDRIGLAAPQRDTQWLGRLIHGFCFACLPGALAMALFVWHGWLGLLANGIALTWMAGVFQSTNLKAD